MQTDQWLMIGIGLTGTAFLAVLIALFVRHKKTAKFKVTPVQPFFTSRLSSEEFYSTVEELEDPPFSLLAYENEMSLKLKLAKHYLDINDQENAVPLLKDVQARGQPSEKDLAEKILDKLNSK